MQCQLTRALDALGLNFEGRRTFFQGLLNHYVRCGDCLQSLLNVLGERGVTRAAKFGGESREQ